MQYCFQISYFSINFTRFYSFLFDIFPPNLFIFIIDFHHIFPSRYLSKLIIIGRSVFSFYLTVNLLLLFVFVFIFIIFIRTCIKTIFLLYLSSPKHSLGQVKEKTCFFRTRACESFGPIIRTYVSFDSSPGSLDSLVVHTICTSNRSKIAEKQHFSQFFYFKRSQTQGR